MRFQLGWLREHVDLPEDAADVAARLTSLGLAVEDREGEGDATVLDVDVTSNRVDATSHVGLARELAAAYGRELRVPAPTIAEEGESVAEAAAVVVEATDLCPRYAARVVRGVEPGASPSWMAERLEACGIRPINVIVDVTNYVLLELGHPLHAFDLDLLANARVIVRRAAEGELLETLDGIERSLTTDDLLIADEERGIALAGVMGGGNTEIRAETRDVLLESAWFEPSSVRRTSRRLGLRSEASYRFERGADVDVVPLALDRAAALLAELAGGRVLAGRLDELVPLPERSPVPLRHARIARVGGVDVARSFVDRLLPRLGFEVLASTDEGWTVQVPRFRRDVAREADLIEEVLRHHGYDRIPSTLPAHAAGARPRAPWEKGLARLRASLVAAGYQQAVHYSFGDPDDLAPFATSVAADGPARRLALTNPLAENLAELRTSLVPGLLRAASVAVRRGEADVRLFEEGRIFLRRPEGSADSPVEERDVVALLATGRSGVPHFLHAPGAVDVLTLKGGLLDALAVAGGRDRGSAFTVRPVSLPWCAPGAAEVLLDGERVGWLGRIHPDVLEPLEIRAPLLAAEADLTAVLPDAAVTPAHAPLSRFPRVVRDLSVLVDRNQSYGDIIAAIRSRFAAPSREAGEAEAIESVELIDRYVGKGVSEDEVSLTFSVAYRRSDRTLTQEEVDALQEELVALLSSEFGARLRA